MRFWRGVSTGDGEAGEAGLSRSVSSLRLDGVAFSGSVIEMLGIRIASVISSSGVLSDVSFWIWIDASFVVVPKSVVWDRSVIWNSKTDYGLL